MADLSSMYQMMLQATNPATWEATRQREVMGEMEISEKQRQMEDDRKLRELFAKNQRPSASEIGAISPAFAQKYSTEQFNLMNQQQQMEQRNQQMEMEYGKVRAPVFGRVAEEYMQNVDSGMPEAQARNVYNQQMGQAAAMLQQQNIPLPRNFSAEENDPQMVLNIAAGLGFQSQYIKQKMDVQAEAAKRQLPPGRTPEQQYGRVEMGPYGPKVQPPLPSGEYRPGYTDSVQQQYGQPKPESNIPEQDIDAFRAYKDSLPANSKERQAAEKALANAIKQSLPGSRFVTPEEETRLNIEKEAELTRAKETTKSDVQRVEEGKRITESFKRAMGEGGVSRVMKMISESTSGATESLAAKAVGAAPFSKATPGMENIGALNTIAGELRKTIERSPGAQSDKDVALAALDAAAIADPSIPYNQRMKGFLEFTRIIKERAKDLGIDPQALGINVDTETGAGPIKVTTKAEAEKLAPGTLFETPDGKIMRRH